MSNRPKASKSLDEHNAENRARLLAIRKELDLTSVKMAELMGATPMIYSQWETGKKYVAGYVAHCAEMVLKLHQGQVGKAPDALSVEEIMATLEELRRRVALDLISQDTCQLAVIPALVEILSILAPDALEAQDKPSLTANRAPDVKVSGLTCPQCQKTSYNPNDMKHQYCGNCRQFLEFMVSRSEFQPA